MGPRQTEEELRQKIIAVVEMCVANNVRPTFEEMRFQGVTGETRRIYLVWDQAIAAGELPPRRGKWQHRTATPAKSHHGPRIEPYRSRVVKNPPPPPPRDEQPHLRVWTLKEICQVWTQRYSDAWSGKGNTFMLKATI